MDSAQPIDTVIIGGGVVGLSSAIYLQRSNRTVTLIDPLPSPGGASFGNAGMISPDTAVPISMPGMLRQVPKWLMDPLGPLVVKPTYFPQAFPWLMKWIAAGRWSKVLEISDAMRSLHRHSLGCWRELIGPDFDALIRTDGQVHFWETDRETDLAARERQIRERHGIQSRNLSADEMRDLFPDMAPATSRAIMVPGNAHTVSPALLVQRLEQIFLQEGGRRVHETVSKLIPRSNSGSSFTILTNVGNFDASNIIICAGAHSAKLVLPLGIRIPLEVERGYHIMLPEHGLKIGATYSNKSRSFGLTPMKEGVRVAGTVEISGLDAIPDERRALMLVKQLQRSFPKVNVDGMTYWSGMRPSMPDSLPVIEQPRQFPGLYLNFGHGHFGMTGGPPSAKLLSQMINRDKPMAQLNQFGLERPTLRRFL